MERGEEAGIDQKARNVIEARLGIEAEDLQDGQQGRGGRHCGGAPDVGYYKTCATFVGGDSFALSVS
jgi:hypothetical protein